MDTEAQEDYFSQRRNGSQRRNEEMHAKAQRPKEGLGTGKEKQLEGFSHGA